ncbi:MAG TPA: NAD-dependent epimerase/dehydratase family protein [Flavobacteriales bacterium]|nr:NAD-dependent epimerase/dehydratase family protein [Flavobacteriales bacterium]
MRILIAGASGLVGSAVLEQALGPFCPYEVVSLVRRSTGWQHPKLTEWLSADGNLLSGLRSEPLDAVICCLGTTIRKVGGDKAKFIHVDKDLVLGLARWAKGEGVRCFAVVSAIGADAKSSVFYNKVKGEMEQELKAIGLPELHIFHPSILTGPRQEKRTGERIGIVVMSLIAPLLPAKYKPMPHEILAKALLKCIGTPGGTHSYRAIRELASN